MVFKELLSRPLAVLLHLSSCHLQPSDNLPQPPASQNVVPSTAPMSSPLPIIAPTSYLQSLFNVTLIKYSKETGIDLATHPLAATIDSCSSIGAVIVAIQEQTWPSGYSKFDTLTVHLIEQLKLTAHTVFLLSPSAALKGNIDLGFPPAKAVFCGICVLLAAARDFDTNYVALVDLFGCVESFLRFLRIYTSIPPALVVIEKAMKILFELLLVLALATTQTRQARLQRVGETLSGEEDVERVLRRLNRLTPHEAETTVTQVLEVVYGLINNIKIVIDGGKGSVDKIRPALVIIQQTLHDVNKIRRDQSLRDFQQWISPPDPSINHNSARKVLYRGTTTWFTRGILFEEWKRTGSLLWIHGKLGSGKTILCSAIIQDIQGIVDAGLASMAYFYCDFRDAKKRNVEGFLSSLLVQLSAQSDICCDILSNLYLTHAGGSRQPSHASLTCCLKDMLKLLVQEPMYIVVDGLDEVPGIPGMPSPRATLLRLVEELINLRLPNLRICILSQLDPEIQFFLEPLASRHICLHEESGQMQDIIHYVRSMLNTHPKMRGWKAADKQVVINKMFRKADGVFRWIVCQLEVLPRSLPATVLRVVDRLPANLDETYERMLLRIPEENWEHTYHAFQCLMVATRPLTIEELALVLAIDFIAEITPKYEEIWRSDEPEDNLVTVCSSFLSFVDVDGSRIAQFSHLSVMEFLVSERISNFGFKVSRYRLLAEPAHTTLAQMCLAVLLHLDDHIDKNGVEEIPMIHYAAQNWVHHARFENVPTYVRAALQLFFDLNRPHLAAWVWLHDIDCFWGESSITARAGRHTAAPLYYAARCGFPDMAERLLTSHPQHLNSLGSRYGTALIAALENGHLEIVWLLLKRGAATNIREGFYGPTLIVASKRGFFEVVQFLLEQGEDVNIWDSYYGTSLNVASGLGHIRIVGLLLAYKAEVNIQGGCYGAPLQVITAPGHLGAAQLLLERSTDMNEQGGYHGTPLHAASAEGHLEIAKLLLEHGAEVNSRAINHETALQVASRTGHSEVVQLLLEHGADATTDCSSHGTPMKAGC